MQLIWIKKLIFNLDQLLWLIQSNDQAVLAASPSDFLKVKAFYYFFASSKTYLD